MSNSIAVSLVVIAVLGVGIAAVPAADKEAIAAVPFWQLHGTVPSATETQDIAQMRLAARQIAEQVVVALQAR